MTASGKLPVYPDEGTMIALVGNQASFGLSHALCLLSKKGGFMPWKLASLGTLLAVALLSGCSNTSESTPDSVTTDPVTTETGHTRCDAKAAEFAIGKQASPQLLEQARARSGAQNARILKPNDMVTLEYRSDRLNLNTDAQLVINRVNCG
jgi:hypothetical protein